MVETYPYGRTVLLADFYEPCQLGLGFFVVGMEIARIYAHLLHVGGNFYGRTGREVDVCNQGSVHTRGAQTPADLPDAGHVLGSGHRYPYKFGTGRSKGLALGNGGIYVVRMGVAHSLDDYMGGISDYEILTYPDFQYFRRFHFPIPNL